MNMTSEATRTMGLRMRIKSDPGGFPECQFEREDCHAYQAGTCQALANTDFGDRDCPFYRSKSDNVREVSQCINILIRKGRTDLIDKYRPVYDALSLLGGEDEFIREAKKRLEEKRAVMEVEIKARKEYVDRIGDEWYE